MSKHIPSNRPYTFLGGVARLMIMFMIGLVIYGSIFVLLNRTLLSNNITVMIENPEDVTDLLEKSNNYDSIKTHLDVSIEHKDTYEDMYMNCSTWYDSIIHEKDSIINAQQLIIDKHK